MWYLPMVYVQRAGMRTFEFDASVERHQVCQ
jgi:hypothetical protein